MNRVSRDIVITIIMTAVILTIVFFIPRRHDTDPKHTEGRYEAVETVTDTNTAGDATDLPETENVKEDEPEEEDIHTVQPEEIVYSFRNSNLLNSHYDKHGRDMGFSSAEEYEAAASAVINNPDALSKTEQEDGDMCYYVEATNEFVVLSTDGYIRTYFLPDSGKSYFDRQ